MDSLICETWQNENFFVHYMLLNDEIILLGCWLHSYCFCYFKLWKNSKQSNLPTNQPKNIKKTQNLLPQKKNQTKKTNLQTQTQQINKSLVLHN